LKGETRPSQLAGAPKSQIPPVQPVDLTEEAAKVWIRILGATEHIGEHHADTLRHYCETTAAMAAMKPKGTKEWRELANVHRQLARELCLTPATGANLGQSRKEPERKLAKYVS
jgi:hypothetical protein